MIKIPKNNIDDKFGDGIIKEREDQFDIMLHHINWL